MEAASQDDSEEILFVSYKIGSITEQVIEGERKARDLQGKPNCPQIPHGEEKHFTEMNKARSRRLGSKKFEVQLGLIQFLK